MGKCSPCGNGRSKAEITAECAPVHSSSGNTATPTMAEGEGKARLKKHFTLTKNGQSIFLNALQAL